MDFRHELRELIDRHITPSSQYDIYITVQTALQQELIRLDNGTNRFSDDEMQSGWEGRTEQWVPLDERERQGN